MYLQKWYIDYTKQLNCEKDILVIEGADHGSAPDVDPETYYEKVFSFLNKYVN